MLRTQLGYLKQHSIRFNCGNCGILISGNVFLNPLKGEATFKFKNAIESNENNAQYYLEASGELLTKKLSIYSDDSNLLLSTPYFRNLSEIGHEELSKFIQTAIGFYNFIEDGWPRVRRINELWLNGDKSHLPHEVNKLLSKKEFPMNNELEYLRGVHQINLLTLTSILEKRFWSEAELLNDHLLNLFSPNYLKLVDEFLPVLPQYEQKLFKCISNFVGIYPFLIPAYGLSFYKVIPDNFFIDYGITTTSIEDIKEFYVDTYETIVEISRLIIAYNNLKHRGSYDKMATKRRDVTSILDYDSLSKGKRLEFFTGEETFDFIIVNYLNNEIRNALGHNTFEVDRFSQLITFYPSGKESTEKVVTMYLVEFAKQCWDLFQSATKLLELVYITRKAHYIGLGQKSVDPNIFVKQNRVHKYNKRKKKK